MASSKTILVIGATGQQGGAVAKQLVENGWIVRALVRNPNKPAAQLLQKQGVEIIQGDLDKPATVLAAMKNTYGVFSVQALDINDLEKEVRYGKTIADCAKQVKVSHFVYSSAAGADRNTGIKSFENKGKIEQYIHALNLPATVLRPVMFMDNFSFILHQANGQIDLPYMGTPEKKIQMIAVHDIGVFTRKVFENPDQYIGNSLEIAGDELTIIQITEIISKKFGIPALYQSSAPKSAHEHDGIKITQFFEREGYKANLESLRQLHPKLLDFESWLNQADILL